MNDIIRSNLLPPIIDEMNGAHQIDLQDLTGGKINVEIPVWINQHVNDIITVYWGIKGQTSYNKQMLVGSTDTPQKTQLDAKLFTLSNTEYQMYYTVYSLGATSTSDTISFNVVNSGSPVSELDTYPAPHLPQAVNGVIDLDALTSDIILVCYPGEGQLGLVQMGDILRGYLGAASAEAPKPLSFPFSLQRDVFIPKAAVSHGGWWAYYEVQRGNELIGRSASTYVQCQSHDFFQAPVFPQAVDGVINLDDNFNYIEMDIAHYGSASEGDMIQGYIGGYPFQPAVVEDPSASVYRAKINKAELAAGTYEASYQVTYADSQRVENSLVTSITLCHGEPEPVDPVWENLKNGKPFYILNAWPGQNMYAYGPNNYQLVVLGNSPELWHAEIISDKDKTFRIYNDTYHWHTTSDQVYLKKDTGTVFAIMDNPYVEGGYCLTDQRGYYFCRMEDKYGRRIVARETYSTVDVGVYNFFFMFP